MGVIEEGEGKPATASIPSKEREGSVGVAGGEVGMADAKPYGRVPRSGGAWGRWEGWGTG